MEYMEALNQGKEVIIIAPFEEYNSAIFWKKRGRLYSFTRELGILERRPEELSEADLLQHFEDMENEEAMIFIRG